MSTKTIPRLTCIENIVNQHRPAMAEFEELRRLEKAGDRQVFERALSRFDKKHHSIPGPEAATRTDGSVVRRVASIVPRENERPEMIITRGRLLGEKLTGIFEGTQASSAVQPFSYVSLNVFDAMSGPDVDVSDPSVTQVSRGVVGAKCANEDEYRVFNGGDTEGTTPVARVGHMDLCFFGEVSSAGEYRLLMPCGMLTVIGKYSVIGHGNGSTCYDAFATVRYYSFLTVGDALIDSSFLGIMNDKTRDKGRVDKTFAASIEFPARYVEFQAAEATTVMLTLRLDAHTEANVDGKANIHVDTFGFYANLKSDYDTVIVKVS